MTSAPSELAAVDSAEQDRSRAASVRAGVAAGIAGFVTFLIVHHLWIVPIWFIAPTGLVLAMAGGAAVGAAYAELLPHLPRRPWTALGVIVIIGVTLLPAIVIAELRGPIFGMDGDDGGRLLVADSEAVAGVVLGLIAAGMFSGAGLAWLIVGTRRAAGTTALAALALALGPGHNIPLLGGTPAVAKEIVILPAVVGVASVVLVEAHAWLMRRGSSPSRRCGRRSPEFSRPESAAHSVDGGGVYALRALWPRISSVDEPRSRASNQKPTVYPSTSRYDRHPRACSSADRASASGA